MIFDNATRQTNQNNTPAAYTKRQTYRTRHEEEASFMKAYDHIIRFALLITAVIAGFFIIRARLVPESFGVQGSYSYAFYRADSADEQAALPAVHQGSAHCSACHAPQASLRQTNAHAGLECETCHGSFKAHNNNTKERMAVSGSVDACMLCHAALTARPAQFPQIDSFSAHVAQQNETLLPGMTCVTCHDPHAPM